MRIFRKIKFLLGLIIYKFAPVKKNRYVFTSFDGHYSDNTKAISEKLHEMDKNAQIVWLVNEKYKKDVPDYAKIVDIRSLKAYWYRGTAATQIDNVYGFRANFKMKNGVMHSFKFKLLSWFTNKKKQPIFATMHGSPLKKIGRDQVGNTVLDMSCPNSYMLVGDDLTKQVLQRVTFDRMPITVLGSPRNDALFCEQPELKKKLGLPADKKFLLFAPTFRNDGKDTEDKNIQRSGLDQLEQMDFDRLFQALSEKFGGDWTMICRFHYHVSNMVNWDELNEKYPGKFIDGNRHDDMADYLACSDALLTDFSSCSHDFCHMYKPCFLFCPDLDHYLNKERGLYIEIADLPYPCATDFESLLNCINTYDQEKYRISAEAFLQNVLGTASDGNASRRVVEHIQSYIKK